MVVGGERVKAGGGAGVSLEAQGSQPCDDRVVRIPRERAALRIARWTQRLSGKTTCGKQSLEFVINRHVLVVTRRCLYFGKGVVCILTVS